MAMRSELTGNVLAAPVLKTVKVKGEDRKICELRVMSASYKPDGNGGIVQDDARTFPVQATIWHETVAQKVFDLVRVGASVVLTGDVFVRPWTNTEKGTAEAGVVMDVERVGLGLHRVEAVEYRAKAKPEDRQSRPETAPADDPASAPAGF